MSFFKRTKSATPTPIKPVTHREMLIASVPLALLYLMQMVASKGLSLSGFLSLGCYLAYLALLLPKLYRRPLTVTTMLIFGGLFALVMAVLINFIHMVFAPWPQYAYFFLIGLSGMDVPSLLIPAFILIFRVTMNLYRYLRRQNWPSPGT